MHRNSLRLPRNTPHHNQSSPNTKLFIRLPSNKKLSAGINIHNTIIFLLRNILHMAKRHNPRVRTDDIQFSEMSFRLSEEGDDVFDDGDIALDGDGVAAVVLDKSDDFLGGGGGGGVVDDDLCAATSELEGHFTTDSSSWKGIVRLILKKGYLGVEFTGAGDECYLALQTGTLDPEGSWNGWAAADWRWDRCCLDMAVSIGFNVAIAIGLNVSN